MSTLALLPCPFCGATPHRGLGKVEHDQLHGDPYQRYRVWCPTCGGYGFDGANARIECADIKAAAEKWNRRIPAEQQPDIDAFLGENRKPVRSLASVMVPSARDLEQQPDSDARDEGAK